MDYLQAQSVRSIIRNSFSIYFRHLPILVLIGGMVLAPAYGFQILTSHSTLAIQVLGNVLLFMSATFAWFPLTVAVSDICIGLKPGVRRSYQRAFWNPGRVLSTYLLLALLQLAAIVALIIPVFVVTALYMFVSPVVVLERLGGRAAFKRSRELGRGYYLRNLGAILAVTLVMILLSAVSMFIVAALVALILILTHVAAATILLATQIAGALADVCFVPLMAMPLILIYYDMRARKEDYGAPQLMEDLKY